MSRCAKVILISHFFAAFHRLTQALRLVCPLALFPPRPRVCTRLIALRPFYEPLAPFCTPYTVRLFCLTQPRTVDIIVLFYLCRCRTTASTSAFQAEDVGSTPITCSNPSLCLRDTVRVGTGFLFAHTAKTRRSRLFSPGALPYPTLPDSSLAQKCHACIKFLQKEKNYIFLKKGVDFSPLRGYNDRRRQE